MDTHCIGIVADIRLKTGRQPVINKCIVDGNTIYSDENIGPTMAGTTAATSRLLFETVESATG